MEERGCVSAVPPICFPSERATKHSPAVALNLSAQGLYRDYNQPTNHSNLLFPRTHLVRARWCECECVRASVRVYTGTPCDYRWTSQSDRSRPVALPHSPCALIASVKCLMDFITCNDTWPTNQPLILFGCCGCCWCWDDCWELRVLAVVDPEEGYGGHPSYLKNKNRFL